MAAANTKKIQNGAASFWSEATPTVTGKVLKTVAAFVAVEQECAPNQAGFSPALVHHRAWQARQALMEALAFNASQANIKLR